MFSISRSFRMAAPFSISLLAVIASSGQLDASLIYEENFDGALGSEWTLDGVGVVSVPTGGRTVVTNANTGYYGTITPSSSGHLWGNLGDTFDPIKTPSSYDAYGFGGSWLVNNISSGSNGDFTVTRSASVSFSDLPTHTSLTQVSLLLGVGDTIDGNEGVFEIRADGVTVFLRDFESGGSIRSTSAYPTPNTGPAPAALVTYANLIDTGFYAEMWNDNGGTGPTNITNRSAQSWTLESAYSLDLYDLTHTGDTLTLDFIWRGVNSHYTDEFIALDTLRVVIIPEPASGAALALLLGGVLMMARRRR